MPSGLIDEEDGVGSWCDRLGDFRQVQVHRFGIAEGQDQSRALALFRADGTEDIGRCGSLIPRRARASAALGPPAGDLVLLADTGFVLEPNFYLADIDASNSRATSSTPSCDAVLSSVRAMPVWICPAPA